MTRHGLDPLTLRELANRIELLPHGETAASRAIFCALGGELRMEPISKQGGEAVAMPYWPGERDPCVGISFSTSELHLMRVLERRRLVHYLWFSPDRGWTARVVGCEGMAATAALSLCAALLRHLAGVAEASSAAADTADTSEAPA
jgi:hypothetical protein